MDCAVTILRKMLIVEVFNLITKPLYLQIYDSCVTFKRLSMIGNKPIIVTEMHNQPVLFHILGAEPRHRSDFN